MNEKQEYIRNVMLKAMAAKLCTNQKEFAYIVGVSGSGLSSAMNGDQKNLMDSFVSIIWALVLEHGLEEKAPTVVVQPEQKMKLTANKNRASLLSGPGTSNHNNIQMSNIGKIHPYRNNKNAESVNDALKPDDFLLSNFGQQADKNCKRKGARHPCRAPEPFHRQPGKTPGVPQ